MKVIDKKSFRNYFHREDEDILFDVHEYLKNNPISDLTFISNDKDFIKVISKLINVLSFNRYMYLGDFSEFS